MGPQTVINKMCAVNTFSGEIKFVIYPNPAKDHINIDMGSNLVMPETVTICDMSGSILLEKIITKDMRFLHIPLDLVDGMYICNFYTSGTTIGSQKLIIRN